MGSCCCCSLTFASQAFSIFGLLGFVGSTSWGIVSLIYGDYEDYGAEYEDAFLAMDCASLAMAITGIIIYYHLVNGVFNRRANYIMPTLIFEPPSIIFYLSIPIAKAMILGFEEYWIASLFVTVCTTVTILLRILFWMVIYSYRKQIISDNKTGNL